MYDSCRTSDKSVLDLKRGSIRKRSIVRSRSRCSVNFRAKSDSSVTESLPDAPAGASPDTLDSGSSGSLMNSVSKRIAKKGSHISHGRSPLRAAVKNRSIRLARYQSLMSPNGLISRLQPKKRGVFRFEDDSFLPPIPRPVRHQRSTFKFIQDSSANPSLIGRFAPFLPVTTAAISIAAIHDRRIPRREPLQA